jgi:hypothetical protein
MPIMAQHSRNVARAIEEGAAPVEEDDEETFVQHLLRRRNVSKMSDYGISVTDINELKEAGIYTIGTIRKPPDVRLLCLPPPQIRSFASAHTQFAAPRLNKYIPPIQK